MFYKSEDFSVLCGSYFKCIISGVAKFPSQKETLLYFFSLLMKTIPEKFSLTVKTICSIVAV